MNWDLAWAIWLGAALVTFAALELWAVFSHGTTLTEKVQRWLGVRPYKPWRGVATGALLLALALLGKHLTGT